MPSSVLCQNTSGKDFGSSGAIFGFRKHPHIQALGPGKLQTDSPNRTLRRAGQAPENTIAAIRGGISLGVDLVGLCESPSPA